MPRARSMHQQLARVGRVPEVGEQRLLVEPSRERRHGSSGNPFIPGSFILRESYQMIFITGFPLG